MANCVVRHAYVRPEIRNRGIEQHVTSSVPHFRDLFQRVVVTLQRPDEIGLFRIGDGRADHVILSLESFFLYVAFGLNCVENMPASLNLACRQRKQKNQKKQEIIR